MTALTDVFAEHGKEQTRSRSPGRRREEIGMMLTHPPVERDNVAACALRHGPRQPQCDHFTSPLFVVH